MSDEGSLGGEGVAVARFRGPADAAAFDGEELGEGGGVVEGEGEGGVEGLGGLVVDLLACSEERQAELFVFFFFFTKRSYRLVYELGIG